MAVTTHFDQGRAAFQAQQDDLAVREFEAALVDEPSSPVYLRSLAFAHLAAGRPSQAEAPARRATEIEPENPEAQFAVGSVFASQQRHRDAIVHLDEVLRINPNHVPARRQLVMSLCQAAHQSAEDHPDFAASAFDRALKIDRNNPDVAAPAMTYLMDHYDVHRVIRLYRDLPETMRNASPVEIVRRRLEEGPDGNRLLKNLGDAPQVQSPARVQAQAGPKTVPCPNCQQPIMEWAAICPHCNFKNRAVGQFATINDTGPEHDWRDWAYYVVCVLWMVPAALSIASILIADRRVNGFNSIQNVYLSLNSLQVLLGIGLLSKVGVIMLVVRYFSYLTLLSSSVGTMFGFMVGRPVEGFINLLSLGFTCFLLYLLNYMDDF